MEDWIEQETGKSADEITIADVQRIPRRQRVRYAPLVSDLGGRNDLHLRHLEDEERDRLRDRGDVFLEQTPDEEHIADTER
jgi:hypothetical protein